MAVERDTRSRRRYRVAFVGTAMLMLGIVVTLPFSLASVVDDVLGPATGNVTPLLRVPPSAIAPTHSRLHLAVTAVDEVQLLATPAVDLSLSMVLLFLLGGLSIKALVLAHDRGGLRLLTRFPRTSQRGVDRDGR